MARKLGKSERPVTDEVRAFLSANGKKGGQTTKKYIELGKRAAAEHGEDVEAEVLDELHEESRDRERGSREVRRGMAARGNA